MLTLRALARGVPGTRGRAMARAARAAGLSDDAKRDALAEERVRRLALTLDRDPDLALELVACLSKDSKIRVANAILDQEQKGGEAYTQYLASRHRRKIMIREISMSMGEDLKSQIDKNQDGHVSSDELDHFLDNLLKQQQAQQLEAARGDKPPTKLQMRQLALLTGVPFIGFGFLDNAIMLIAGDMIDVSIGRALGISTLAAAGLGNLVSDVAGLGLSGYIEASAKRLGLVNPKLTLRQMNTRAVRILQFLATSIGITIGCLLGMLPLLLMDPEAKDMNEMFSTLDDNDNGRVSPRQLIDMITDNEAVLGQANVHILVDRANEQFADLGRDEQGIDFAAFRDFVTGLRERGRMRPIDERRQWALQLTEVAGCETESCKSKPAAAAAVAAVE